jgi:choline dehydrogenase-like flavoprotein
MNDPVDVLIIGAGASGAAVAWSLAETKMHILCLEQGDWMNPAQYPSAGRDWEARAYGDYSPSPNIRARPEDYPINDDHSPNQGRELQRRWRLYHHVYGAFSAASPFGFSRAHAGWRGRGLAD